MSTRRTTDAIVARVLPYMPLEHTTAVNRIRDFTLDEATQLNFDGLPLLMNHNDGEHSARLNEARPRLEVGRVDASAIDGLHTRVLASFDPDASDEATMVSNLVARGVYEGVSLGNTVAMHATDGMATFVKTPQEISVCERGRRHGSIIEGYFPCRATLERLAEHAPTDLETLIDRHGYRDAVIASNVSATDSIRYIDVLVAASDKRLADTVARYNLFPKMSVQASDSPVTDTPPAETAPMDTESAQQQPPAQEQPPAQQQPPVQEQPPVQAQPPVQVQQTRSVATPASPNLTSLKEITEAALAAKQQNVEYLKTLDARTQELADRDRRLAEMEANMAKMQAENERFAQHQAQEKEKERKKFEGIIETYVQRAKRAGFSEPKIEATVESGRDSFEKNQNRGIQAMESALEMAVIASDRADELERQKAKTMQAQADKFNESFLSSVAKKFTEMDSQASHLQQRIESTYAQRFETTPAAAAPVQPAAPAPVQQPVVAQQPMQQQQQQQQPVAVTPQKRFIEKPAATHFTTVKASDQFPLDESELLAEYVKATNKLPSMRDMQFGTMYVPTGRMQASVDGMGEEPVYERKRLRSTPARIEPANFAPEWDAKLMEQHRVARNKPRFHAKRWTMTNEGNIYGQ